MFAQVAFFEKLPSPRWGCGEGVGGGVGGWGWHNAFVLLGAREKTEFCRKVLTRGAGSNTSRFTWSSSIVVENWYVQSVGKRSLLRSPQTWICTWFEMRTTLDWELNYFTDWEFNCWQTELDWHWVSRTVKPGSHSYSNKPVDWVTGLTN